MASAARSFENNSIPSSIKGQFSPLFLVFYSQNLNTCNGLQSYLKEDMEEGAYNKLKSDLLFGEYAYGEGGKLYSYPKQKHKCNYVLK